MTHCRATVLASLLLCLAATLAAQSPKPGAADAQANQTAFQSRMVLETVFPMGHPAFWASDWFAAPEWTGLGKYTCDNVALHGDLTNRATTGAEWETGLSMRVRDLRNGFVGGNLELRFRVTAFNPAHNHDKSVTVVVDMLNGTKVIGTGTIGPFAVDEGGTESDETKIVLPMTDIRDATKVRLTVTTKDE